MVFHELPLVIFTVLAQCAVGAFLVITLRLACPVTNRNKSFPVQSVFFVLGFMAIGFFASTMHLGSPFRAFNSLNRVGHSSLSNEIASGSVFFALAGIYWLTELLNLGEKGIRTGLRVLAAIAGIVFMCCMQAVYRIDTVPLWDTVFTPVEFFSTVITTGVLFGYVLLNLFSATTPGMNKVLVRWGVLFTVVHLILLMVRSFDMMNVTTAIHNGAAQLSQVSTMIIFQAVLMIIAVILWAVSVHKSETGAVKSIACLALIIALAAELFGRGAFYGLHFTSGLL